MRFTAEVLPGDENRPYAQVRVLTDGGDLLAEFTVHESLVHPDTINVEVQHDFEDGIAPSIRVHYNDALVIDTDDHDWREAPALTDTRQDVHDGEAK